MMITIRKRLPHIIQVEEVQSTTSYPPRQWKHMESDWVRHQAEQRIRKIFDFNYFPRTSDIVEQSISSVDPPSIVSGVTTTTSVTTGILEEQTSFSSKRPLTKTESIQTANTGRRQSLLRSPSSKYSIQNFLSLVNQQAISIDLPCHHFEQGLLSPPISLQACSY